MDTDIKKENTVNLPAHGFEIPASTFEKADTTAFEPETLIEVDPTDFADDTTADPRSNDKGDSRSARLGISLPVGLLLGALIGKLLFNELIMGMGFGMIIGMFIGLLIPGKKKDL